MQNNLQLYMYLSIHLHLLYFHHHNHLLLPTHLHIFHDIDVLQYLNIHYRNSMYLLKNHRFFSYLYHMINNYKIVLNGCKLNKNDDKLDSLHYAHNNNQYKYRQDSHLSLDLLSMYHRYYFECRSHKNNGIAHKQD